MNDFLYRVFLQGPGAGGSDFITDYIVGTVVIFFASAITIYLLTLLLLASPAYRSDLTINKIDTDTRVKICVLWACLVGFLLLGGAMFWIRWASLIPHERGVWNDFRSLACYATALLGIAATWVVFYFNLREDVKRASKALA